MLTLRSRLIACAATACTALAGAASFNDAAPSKAASSGPGVDQLRSLLANFGAADPASDLNADGRVDTADLLIALSNMQADNASNPLAPVIRRMDTIEPAIVGIGTKIRIRGAGLGSKANSAVVFGDNIVADSVEKHTSSEVIVTVPKGAPSGDGAVRVVVGAGDAATLKAMNPVARSAALSRGVPATPRNILVVNSFTSAPRKEATFSLEPLRVVPHRMIIGLHDFEGFETAVKIANSIDAQLAGFIAPGNSYVLDTRTSPADYAALLRLMRQVKADPRVVDVCPDIIFEFQAPDFATADFLTRYGTSSNAALKGREDAWNMDRIQAPAAWNLIQRFGQIALGVPKIAVLDSGVDVTAGDRHAEFIGVNITQVAPATASRVNIAGTSVTLPIGITDVPYTRGDAQGHGTSVCSIIAARNRLPIPGAGTDPGVNGVCAPQRFVDSLAHLQIHRAESGNYPDEPGESGAGFGLTEFLAVINYAALTDCRLINASFGMTTPIDPVGPNPPFGSPADAVRVGLRKLAKQLDQWRGDVLLCVAATNGGLNLASYKGGEITPFEDLNLNNRLDAGEDLDNDGALDHGNHIGASLGTLPNVIAVGAIIGAGEPDPADIRGSNFQMHRDDERWARDFGPNSVAPVYANASCWGTRRTPGPGQPADPTDLVVQLAAPGGDEILTAAAGLFRRFQIGSQWYTWFGGTSAATPTVCGSAALLLTIDPDLTGPQLKQRLLATSMPILTKDKAGNDLRWNTLKVGAAVRQLLVDKGQMANDAEWSGTSRIFDFENSNQQFGTIDIIAREVRQNPVTRRSEIFRQTFVARIDRTGLFAPLTLGSAPNSDVIAYFENGDIKVWSLVSSSYLSTFPAPANMEPKSFTNSIPFTSAGVPFTSWRASDPDCSTITSDVRIWFGSTPFMTGTAAPPGHKYAWSIDYCLRPDNRTFYRWAQSTDHTIDPANPPCNFLSSTDRNGAGLHPVPSGLIVLPVALSDTARGFAKPFWSPDGRLVGGWNGSNGLVAHRSQPNGALAWSSTFPSGEVVWSPDGSEFVLQGNLLKRNATEAIPEWIDPNNLFSWSW